MSWPGSGGKRLAIEPRDPKIVYAVDAESVFKTEDSGATWKKILGQNEEFVTIALVPENPVVVYASAAVGVFQSTDSGATWQRQPTERINNVGLLSRTSLLGGTYLGISRSMDEGKTWIDSSSGLRNVAYIYDLYADRRHAGVAWATKYSGLLEDNRPGRDLESYQ